MQLNFRLTCQFQEQKLIRKPADCTAIGKNLRVFITSGLPDVPI